MLVATTFAGLMSGFFYAYSCSVMPGLSRLDDYPFISAMQSINRAIQNPVFFTGFFGVLILLPLVTYLKYSSPASPVFWYLLCATVIYVTGVFLVTVVGNIPRNNALAKIDLPGATKELLSTRRKIFETKWNTLNIIRTVCATLAFIFALIACLKCYEHSTIIK